jgi:hypothetical protein
MAFLVYYHGERVKISISFVVAGLLLLIQTVFISAGLQKTEWKGKIEYENGIKVVKNPGEPLYGNIEFELEEDLNIGKEDDENYMFYGGISLALDKQDNIYALDGKSCRIQEFDKKGRYLRTIGRKGQGPGEFELPFKLFLDGKNYIYVLDRRSLKIFNDKGEFLETVKLTTFITDFYVSPDGNIFASSELRDEKGSTQAVMKMDSQGKIVKKVAEFPYIELIVRKSGDVTYSFGASRHVYIPELCFSALNGQTFCYAYSAEFKIFLLDEHGNTSLIFQKEESPQAVNRKEKDSILDQMKERYKERGRSLPEDIWEEVQFPSHRPFFDHILADDMQRLYVRRLKSVLNDNNEVEFDIFGREGLYLYKLKLPFTPRAIINGFVYKVDMNEESGEIKLRKLKVINWDQIKKGS